MTTGWLLSPVQTVFSDNRQRFFLIMVPDFFRIVDDFFSMTSTQREDVENGKFSRSKLFYKLYVYYRHTRRNVGVLRFQQTN